MKLRVLTAMAVVGLALLAFHQRTLAASDKPVDNTKRVPVIVELFTSEGCSSCPPADALLRKLDESQPVANAEIIVLGNHVDYWNYTGWTDRFSSPLFSERQRQYSFSFDLDSVYTPEMVVNGHTEFNGADASRAIKEITAAAIAPRIDIGLTLAELSADSGRFKVQIEPSPLANNADVVLAITESHLETQVKRGENEGRKLTHTGVVHILKKIGEMKTSSFSAEPLFKLDPSWKRPDLRAVVFVQEKKSRHIIGAAAIKLAN